MIATAATWAREMTQADEATSLSAYADNWSWWVPLGHNLQPSMHVTSIFCQWMGLEIDWQKTWTWTTSSSNHLAVQQLETIEDVPQLIAHKVHADDLGCSVTYHGNAILGKMSQRLDEAGTRLNRIQKMPWQLQVKVRIIIASVYTAAFYGSELVALGPWVLINLISCGGKLLQPYLVKIIEA